MSIVPFCAHLPAHRSLIVSRLLFFFSYVDQGTAAASNLTYSTVDTFVMRADDQKIVTSGQRGRDSVRIASKKLYNDVRPSSFLLLASEALHSRSLWSLIFPGSDHPRSCAHARGLRNLASFLDRHTGRVARRWRDRHHRGSQRPRTQPVIAPYDTLLRHAQLGS